MWTLNILLCVCFLWVLCSIPLECTVIQTKIQAEDGSEAESHIFSGHASWNTHTTFDHKMFLQQLFHKYGNNGVMTYDGFENLLSNIGLVRLVSDNHNDSYTEVTDSFEKHNHYSSSHKYGNKHRGGHGAKLRKHKRGSSEEESQQKQLLRGRDVSSFNDNDEIVSHHNNTKPISNSTNSIPVSQKLTDATFGSDVLLKCLTATELMSVFDMDPHHDVISEEKFAHLCPAIIYELDQPNCRQEWVNHRKEHHRHHPIPDEMIESTITPGVSWAYACISVVVISLCGLLGVAVIPVMQKHYYQYILQFLVALAVGSLAGDALLHLLPHAFLGEVGTLPKDHSVNNHNEESYHMDGVWKGLVAFLCVQFFFVAEKLLNLLNEWKRWKTKVPSEVRVMKDNSIGSSEIIGEKLCKYRGDVFNYCYGDITATMVQNNGGNDSGGEEGSVIKPLTEGSEEHRKEEDCHYPHDDCLTESHLPLTGGDNHHIKVPSGRLSPSFALLHSSTMGTGTSRSDESSTGANGSLETDDKYTVILQDQQDSLHGHTHAHGHVRAPPTTVSAVAWMVIMGDGLHNFSDGLAIGAAFSAGITSGLSTSIAVFCHELPHEIGDFAVLIKAGMTAKQAVFYNILSSVFCFVGMILGLFLGNLHAASTWIFAGAAGLFLYIALVDMIPELNGAQGNSRKDFLYQLILQILGISIGGLIMLVIAMFEHELKNIFQS